MMTKRAQVTIFIIVAIVIVGGIILYFALRENFHQTVPSDLRPAYDYYISCLKDTADGGIQLLGEQGGRIKIPEFQPGSAYMPFSSQLNFLGQPIPYWMYVSGNNLLKESVPTKQSMERELNNYVSERLGDCDFSSLQSEGYDIYVGNGSVVSTINDLSVGFKIKNRVTIFKNNESVIINNHDFSVSSKLGKFYKLAIGVYNYEKSNMFLEKYALDVMRLYAPVDGTKIGCAPKIFVESKIRKDIVNGLAANIPSLKLKGDYYDLSSKAEQYFVTNTNSNIDEDVNFMYMPNWPTVVRMYGDKVAKPIGLQPGMSAMGFCYVPYHFVYDIDFPVLIQFYDDNEVFQFPIAVVISKNQARSAVPTTAGASIESKVCEFKNQNVSVHTYDTDLSPVNAQIQFKCLNSICDIGETKTYSNISVLNGKFPQCVNGFIIASAKGYAESKYQISTNDENRADIILNKKYNLSLSLPGVKKALISFSSDDYSATVVYPETKSVELIEGYYNVSVYAYDNSSLEFPATTKHKCIKVPQQGLSGLFGAESEKCYTINMPAMNIDFAVVGGGKNREYITSDDLKHSTKLNINVPMFGLPKNLEELQSNNFKVDDEMVDLEFTR